jgi:diguanylate cyclase (GGDEF)-like protein
VIFARANRATPAGPDSRRDSLTGLLNRSGLLDALAARQADGAETFALFILDLDDFRRVNEARGHAAGDKVLQAVAGRLRTSLRAGDAVARLGGDQFAVLAPDLTPEVAERLAGDMIGRVAASPYLLAGIGHVRVGVSIGYVCAPEDGAAPHELRRKADVALYQIKGAGKGRQRRFAVGPVAAPIPERVVRLDSHSSRLTGKLRLPLGFRVAPV